jgi:S-adenosylmethionine hydrolase
MGLEYLDMYQQLRRKQRGDFGKNASFRIALMEIVEGRILLSSSMVTPSQLVIIQQPNDAIAGQKISPIIVDLLDSSGNVVTQTHAKVTLNVLDADGTAVAHYTTANTKDGEAIFKTVSLQKVGTYSVQAQDGALSSAASNSFSIAASKGAKLIFSQSPVNPLSVGSEFSVQVQVVDRFGNIALDTQHRAIQVSLASHPRLATIGGLTKQSTDNGLLTFSNLSVSLPGDYTLKAAMAGASAKSSEFIVTYNSSNLSDLEDAIISG